MESKLLSLTEVAEYLRITPQRTRALIRENKIFANKVGSQWVIRKEDVDNYVKKYNVVIEPLDHKRKTDDIPDIVALSFFSGGMGLDIGMKKGGISPLLACEVEKAPRMTIQANDPDIALIGDIWKYSPEKIREYARIPENRKIDVMFGGPPCQAFSTAGKRKGFDDSRGNVFIRYLDLIGMMRPTYAVIENVRGLLSTKAILRDTFGEPIKGGVLAYALKKLKSFGYKTSFELYNTANFGVAQKRERVVIIAKLNASKKLPHLTPTHSETGENGLSEWVPIKNVLQGLDQDQHYIPLATKRLKYFKHIPEGGNWRSLSETEQKEAMGKSYYLGGGKTGFYRRLSFDKPSPTLVTNPTMPATDLVHPVENRPLSVEEYARIQGFPDDWIICGSLLEKYKQIGNAVPIKFAQAIAKCILDDMMGISVKEYKGYKYSRYKYTNELTWKQDYKSRLTKLINKHQNDQLSLL